MSKCFPLLKLYIDLLEHYYIQNLLIYSFFAKDAQELRM